MYCVFWLEPTDGGDISHHKRFGTDQLTQALEFVEQMRCNSSYMFITIASQNPNSVGKQGVSDKLPEGYDWKKRRT